MSCRKFEHEYKSLMADLLLDPEQVPAEARAHVEQCADCSKELKALQSTMLALDGWEGVEPSPFFDARMAARMLFGSNMHLRPLAAGALALLLLIGGGTFAGFKSMQSSMPVAASATVKDLQSLDENAQVFQTLNSLDENDNSGASASQGSN